MPATTTTITVVLGRTRARVAFDPGTCPVLQPPRLWAALDFDAAQIEFLRVTGLRPVGHPVPIASVPMRFVGQALERCDESAAEVTGIPTSRLNDGETYEVVVRDTRDLLAERLTDEQRRQIDLIWATVAVDGEYSVPVGVVLERVRAFEMDLLRESVQDRPDRRDLLERLFEQKVEQELALWRTFDVRRTGYISKDDLVLGVGPIIRIRSGLADLDDPNVIAAVAQYEDNHRPSPMNSYGSHRAGDDHGQTSAPSGQQQSRSGPVAPVGNDDDDDVEPFAVEASAGRQTRHGVSTGVSINDQQRPSGRVDVQTQTSPVNGNSDDDDDDDDDDDGDGQDDAAATETETASESVPGLDRVRRKVVRVVICRPGSWWNARTIKRVMLLHSSPDMSAHAIWYKKPSKTWEHCEYIPVERITRVVSGPGEFPGNESSSIQDGARDGFHFTIEYASSGSADDDRQHLHVSMKRERDRDAWCNALHHLIQQR